MEPGPETGQSGQHLLGVRISGFDTAGAAAGYVFGVGSESAREK